MLINGTAHLHGDKGSPGVHCERIEILSQDYAEGDGPLALLFRVLDDPETRERLLDAALAIEAEELACSDVLTG